MKRLELILNQREQSNEGGLVCKDHWNLPKQSFNRKLEPQLNLRTSTRRERLYCTNNQTKRAWPWIKNTAFAATTFDHLYKIVRLKCIFNPKDTTETKCNGAFRKIGDKFKPLYTIEDHKFLKMKKMWTVSEREIKEYSTLYLEHHKRDQYATFDSL